MSSSSSLNHLSVLILGKWVKELNNIVFNIHVRVMGYFITCVIFYLNKAAELPRPYIAHIC